MIIDIGSQRDDRHSVDTFIFILADLSAGLDSRQVRHMQIHQDQTESVWVLDQHINSIFAIGMILFLATLTLNVISRRIVARFREVYD